MNNQELAQAIIEQIGDRENVSQHWHCITRLRFNLKDDSKVNMDKINDLKGVIGSQFSSGQFQVIIGAKVAEVYEEVAAQIGTQEEDKSQGNKKVKPLDVLFDVISGIFTPILPAIVGSGLLKGFMALFVAFNWLSTSSSSYAVLNLISDAAFYFLPFLVAMTAARKFKTKESLALALAGMLLYPTLVNGAAAGKAPLSLFGLAIPQNSYSSSVLPIILGVLLLSIVSKWVDKWVPKSLNIIFSPLISLLITAPLVLAFLAPLGNFLGVYLQEGSTALFHFAGPVAGLVIGGLVPIIVLTGMHYAFFPSILVNIQKLGYDNFFLPLNLVANVAQAGAVTGVFLRSKNTENKAIAASTIVPAIFGITEPAIYGVTLRLRRPFYASLAGGAVGGLIFGTFAVKSTAFAIPGIASLPTYIIKGTNNLIYACIGYVASFVVALIVTLMIGFDEKGKKAVKVEKVVENNLPPIENVGPIEILAPLSGKQQDLSTVPDPTFSTGLLGQGVAILPDENSVQAPFDGTVTMTTPTNHAIGLTSVEGVELLIHVGIDTVEMKGEGFARKVEQGDKVKKRDKLLIFDLNLIKEKGYNPITSVIVTNSPNYLDVVPLEAEKAKAVETKIVMCIN